MTKSKISIYGLSLLALGIILYSCNKDDDTTVTPTGTPTEGVSITSVVQSKYTSAVTTSVSNGFITLTSKGIPNHVSAYWGEGNALYEENPTGVNPGIIRERDNIMTIPTNPTPASVKEVTQLGAIGMALNGVPIYNDREGGNVPLDEMVLQHFDRAGAHVGPSGYHYHVSGDFTTKDDANLVGFLRDGFPIYGRKCVAGDYPSDLDANGGHTSTTEDFSTAIYHYHCSNTNYLNLGVYILKAGSYHGTKGTYVQ